MTPLPLAHVVDNRSLGTQFWFFVAHMMFSFPYENSNNRLFRSSPHKLSMVVFTTTAHWAFLSLQQAIAEPHYRNQEGTPRTQIIRRGRAQKTFQITKTVEAPKKNLFNINFENVSEDRPNHRRSNT